MKSNQMYLRELMQQLGGDRDDVESIFMKTHTTKEGMVKPIVSMTDSHLVNTIRLSLEKKLGRYLTELENQVKVDLLQGYAPSDMDDRVRGSLGLRKISPEKEAETRAKVEELMDVARTVLVNKALKLTMPYIVVAITRASIRDEVGNIISQATGITEQVNLPEYTVYPTMTEREVLELTGGHPMDGFIDNEDDDWERDPDEGDR